MNDTTKPCKRQTHQSFVAGTVSSFTAPPGSVACCSAGSMASAVLAALTAQPAVANLLAVSGLAQSSAEVQLGAVVATALAGLVVLLSLLKALFGRKDLPPTVACLPLVGGFIRFLKVRSRALGDAAGEPCPRHRGPAGIGHADRWRAVSRDASAALGAAVGRRKLGLARDAC